MLPLIYLAVLLGVLASRPRSNPSPEDDSMIFHGDPDETRQLTARERRPLAKEQMVIGEAESVTYRVPSGSKRAGLWKHNFGDGGVLAPSSAERPLLVEKSGRLALVQGKSKARFNARVGLLQ